MRNERTVRNIPERSRQGASPAEAPLAQSKTSFQAHKMGTKGQRADGKHRGTCITAAETDRLQEQSKSGADTSARARQQRPEQDTLRENSRVYDAVSFPPVGRSSSSKGSALKGQGRETAGTVCRLYRALTPQHAERAPNSETASNIKSDTFGRGGNKQGAASFNCNFRVLFFFFF